MDLGSDLRLTAVGFAAAFVILGVLFWLIGIDAVVRALAPLRPAILVVIGAVALAWLGAWGLSLHTVLGVLDVRLPMRAAVLLFAAAQFSNNVTPFGQAGGEPVSALLISRRADIEYESGLAAIASVDALNFVPSIVFAVIGIAYYATRSTLGPRLSLALLVVILLGIGVPVLGYASWRHRGRLVTLATGFVTPFARIAGRAVPNRTAPPRQAVRRRVEGFVIDIGRVARDRERLGVALAYSSAGWLAIAASLWLSLYAIGIGASFSAVIVIVPVAAIAGVTPFPGGLGGIEAVMVLLLVTMTPATPGGAGAAVIVHRLATYWLPIVIGGGAAAMISIGGNRESRA